MLYPGTRICIASGTRGQSINVLEKILQDLKPESPELAAEIDEKATKINGTDAQIVFKNTSVIKVVTASDSARGNRATLLLLDEFRMVAKDVIDTILRKFLTLRRRPRYEELTKEERKKEYDKEKSKIMYLSSAYWSDHWSYRKCVDTQMAMLEEGRQNFICGLPYHLSIYEGLLDRSLIEEEMSETDFNEIKFSMEYEACFYGEADGSFFDFNSVAKNRKIGYAMLPDKVSALLPGSSKVRIRPKQPGELRILSADIALMSSKKHNNDATAIFVNQLVPTKSGRYSNNIVYCDSFEGLHTEQQALVIRRLYEEYRCDYIVLDCAGVGLGVYDALARELYDTDTGEIYPPLSCCNDNIMAERCMSRNAEKVIWSIKGNAALNSACAVLLREGFKTGKIRLLATDDEAEMKHLSEIKGFSSLSTRDKSKILAPYIHTNLLIDELIKLQYEEAGGKIRIYEKSGMRKDRYSSLSYNYYVATQLESKLNRKQSNSNYSVSDVFMYRSPKQRTQKTGRW